MYVKNSKDVEGLEKFYCNGIVATYLIYTKHLPLFGMENGKHVFIKTEEFNKVWETLPKIMKIGINLM